MFSEGWRTIDLRCRLDTQVFTELVHERLKATFSHLNRCEWRPVANLGFWLICEFDQIETEIQLQNYFDANTIQSHHGTLGIQIRFQTYNEYLSINFSDFFFVGRVPSRFYFELSKIVSDLICLKPRLKTLSESCYDLQELIAVSSNLLTDDCQNGIHLPNDLLLQCELTWSEAAIGIAILRNGALDFSTPLSSEVMEDREMRSLKNDEKFDTPESVDEELKEIDAWEKNQPFIQRRRALVDFSLDREISEDFMRSILARESRSMFYMSLGARTLTNANEAISCLSRLNDLIEEKLTASEDIVPLQCAMSETLGDLWLTINPDAALKCFQRLQQIGTILPRHYLKTAKIAQASGESDHEIEAWKQFLKLIKERSLIARVNFRLAVITSQFDDQRALEFALEALMNDRANLSLAMFAAEILLKKGQALQAIQVIDTTIEKIPVAMNRTIDLIHARIRSAEIWKTFLGRDDLAYKRLIGTISIATENPEWLALLAEQTDLPGNEKFDQAYESMFYSLLTSNRYEQALHYLILFSSKCGDPKNNGYLERMFAKYSELKALPLNQLAEVMQYSWHLDWQKIYEHFKSEKPEDSLAGTYHQILAKIAIEKLENTQAAAEHLEALGLSESTELSMVIHASQLIRNLSYPDRALHVLQNRLTLNRPGEDQRLLEAIVAYEDLLDDDRIDKLILMLYCKDSAWSERVTERLSHYANDPGRIYELLRKTLDVAESDNHKLLFLSHGVKLMEANAGGKTSSIAVSLYKQLFELSQNSSAVAERAIRGLGTNAPPQALRPFVVNLIQSGILPELPLGQIQKILAGDATLLGLIHELALSNNIEDDQVAFHARSLLALVSNWKVPFGSIPMSANHRENFSNSTEAQKDLKQLSLLEVLARCTILSAEELDKLIQLSVTANKVEQLPKILHGQFEKASKDQDKSVVAHRAILAHRTTRLPAEHSYEYYVHMIRHIPDPIPYIFELTRFVMEQGPSGIPFLKYCFDESKTWDYQDEIQRVVAWLARTEPENPMLAEIQAQVLDFAGSDSKKFLTYEQILTKLGLGSLNLKCAALKIYQIEGNESSLKICFQQCLKILQSAGDARDFIGECSETFREFRDSNCSIFKLFDEQIIKNEPIISNQEIARELNISFIIWLFENNEDMGKYASTIRQKFAENPDDHRIWPPLYFLLRDSYAKQEMYELLKHILPHIRKSPKYLKNLPVTLESLEREYETLAPESQQSIKSVIAGQEQILGEISNTQSKPEPYSESKRLEDASLNATPVQIGIHEKQHETDLRFGSTLESPPSSHELEELASDWRITVRSRQHAPGMTKHMVDTAFENALEKHLAVQSFAIISGDTGDLSSWDMNVWRNYQTQFYQFEINDRISKHHRHPQLSSHLYKLLSLLVPVMLKVHRKIFSLESIAETASIQLGDLIDSRTPILWGDQYLEQLGIARYKKKLVEDGLVCFSLSGLKDKILYDYRHKALYIDGGYYRTPPVSVAFHRIMTTIRAVKLGYYPILHLDAETQLMPLLDGTYNAIRSGFKSGLAGGLKILLPKSPDSLESYLRELDQTRLASLYSRVGHLNLKAIQKVQAVLWDHLYKIQLSETLDLIGLTEMILDRDILQSKLEPLEALRLSNFVAPLLDLATMINVD